MRLFSLLRRGQRDVPANVRLSVETLDGRVMPARLSLTASAFAAVQVAPIACATPASNADFCIAINVNVGVRNSCAPTSCAPTPPACIPTPCAPSINLCDTAGQVTNSLGSLVQNVGRKAATDLRAVGGLVNGVVRQAALDVQCATSTVGDVISGIGCRPYTLAC